MPVKTFLISPQAKPLAKEKIQQISKTNSDILLNAALAGREKNEAIFTKEVNDLKCVEGRVIVKVDTEYKNQVAIAGGGILELGRKFNNLDQKYTQPVNAIVIDSEYIPKGAEILIHHNCTHDTYKIFNYTHVGGEETIKSVHYFSVPEDKCYLYTLDGETWLPLNNFATGLRCFKPYKGILHGIEPTLIRDVLYVTSGELKGKVCHTLRSCDYEITFNDRHLKEQKVIRFRHSEDEQFEREEITAISEYLTEEVEKGNVYIGLGTSDCKPISETFHVEASFK